RGSRSRLTAWLERRAVRRRGETRDLHFRPRADTERAVTAAGLQVSRPGRSALRLLDDAFTIGTRPTGAT
ncbi:MAG: hypothetical protein FJ104_12445, partial [Deltaproteobacteria bacterium]|nr:hypothetical protein [Deltaproteobacteria bacterium]